MSTTELFNIKTVDHAPEANPLGTDGFEFIEYASPNFDKLKQQFENMGFIATKKHNKKNITLFQQGKINFFINNEPNSQATNFTKIHGAGAVAMGFRVKDAEFAFKQAVSLGAKPYNAGEANETAGLNLPAIYGIGGTVIYFIDANNQERAYDTEFKTLTSNSDLSGAGLQYIDHLTHNVFQGNMDTWADFYKNLFNFRQIRFFDITGKMTGLISRALTSPCGKIKIPLNESKDPNSQIEEFLREFNGEGIQHIALTAKNIYDSIDNLRQRGLAFLDTPDTYYEAINKRVPGHQEDIQKMQQRKILIDGNPETGDGVLLQIFTENMLGPVFFEIIQRKENEGFGEGNFQALFDSIELDQIRRGVLSVEA